MNRRQVQGQLAEDFKVTRKLEWEGFWKWDDEDNNWSVIVGGTKLFMIGLHHVTTSMCCVLMLRCLTVLVISFNIYCCCYCCYYNLIVIQWKLKRFPEWRTECLLLFSRQKSENNFPACVALLGIPGNPEPLVVFSIWYFVHLENIY